MCRKMCCQNSGLLHSVIEKSRRKRNAISEKSRFFLFFFFCSSKILHEYETSLWVQITVTTVTENLTKFKLVSSFTRIYELYVRIFLFLHYNNEIGKIYAP
jgi:hypothetical protein